MLTDGISSEYEELKIILDVASDFVNKIRDVVVFGYEDEDLNHESIYTILEGTKISKRIHSFTMETVMK